MRKWDEMNPAPRINADPEREPLAYAQQLFQAEDHHAERSHLATGKVGPKRSLIPLGGKDGYYAMRDEHGRVSTVNEEMLKVKEFATQYGVKEGEVLSNGGVYGKTIDAMIGGKLVKQRTFTSFPDNKVSMEMLPGKTPEQLSKDQEHIADFLFAYGSGDPELMKKHPVAKAVDEMEQKGVKWDQIAPMLKQKYGVNFVAPKEASFWAKAFDLLPFVDSVDNGYVKSDKTKLAYFPGEPTPLRINQSITKMVYYDDISDTVYTPEGTRLGKPDQARAMIASEMEKMEKKKRFEEEMKALEKEGEEEKMQRDKRGFELRNPSLPRAKYSSMWE
jgi:hypothetical protein